VSRRQTDNTRVHQYPWEEDRQTIQEFINILEKKTDRQWYWWTIVLSVRLLLTDIDELLYCLSVFYSQILMNTRVHQYPWIEDGQTIQEFINICEKKTDRQYNSSSICVSRRQTDNARVQNSCIVCLSSTHGYWLPLVVSVRLLLTDIDELLYCLSVFYLRILMNFCIVCLIRE
jgi:hypothetical protein